MSATYLAEKPYAAGAKLVITDVNQDALREVGERTGFKIVLPHAYLRC